MRLDKRLGVAVAVMLAVGLGASYFMPSASMAQDAPKAAIDVASALRHNIATQVVTITFESQRGAPKAATASARFDRDIEACWVSVVGTDIKFARSTEKQINRQMFEVDPFVKVVNGRTAEVSGKLGIKDGSGDFDDTYEGTITVAITAILSAK
jgi:hypothetical protein